MNNIHIKKLDSLGRGIFYTILCFQTEGREAPSIGKRAVPGQHSSVKCVLAMAWARRITGGGMAQGRGFMRQLPAEGKNCV